MRKITAFLLALGAGAALLRLAGQRRKADSTRQWVRVQPGTAVVTGASSGIGAAFARILAREGYHLIILARREARLNDLAQEIQAYSPVKVEVVVADLDNPADLERAAQYISSIADLDLLVNNAGFGAGGHYAEIDPDVSASMARVHILASMRLAHAVLPGMIARQRGGIINVSSMAGFLPMGGSTVYGATKAYLNFFSESLQMELQGTGVRVQALCPGFTYTEIHDKGGRPDLPAFLWMEPEDVVHESLQGLRENQLFVVPGTIYRFGADLIRNPLVAPLTRLLRTFALPLRSPGPG